MAADLDYLRGLTIERFDGTRHDRSSFRCGIDRIDNFFRATASAFVKEDNGRIFVAVERASGRLAGFYALGPHAIDIASLDPGMIRRMPRTDRIGAFYLAMIAVHADLQNRGLGGVLLADALQRCLRLADEIGGRFIVLDAIGPGAAALYARYGFVPLASQPDRMVLGMGKLRASERERQARSSATP